MVLSLKLRLGSSSVLRQHREAPCAKVGSRVGTNSLNGWSQVAPGTTGLGRAGMAVIRGTDVTKRALRGLQVSSPDLQAERR